jgi:hypothetical protein
MAEEFSKSSISRKYVSVLAIAVFVSWVLHELAHWAVGEYLGYEMGMALNSSFPLSMQYSHDSHYQIISAAGPIFTLLQALIIFALMLNKKVVLFYPFLFVCFYMRLFAFVISIRHANDEARISSALNIGKYTLPLLVTTFLFLLVYKISKLYKFNFKFNLANLGLTIFFSSIIILVDMYFKIRFF